MRYGYDRQSKVIEFVKSIIPKHYIGKIKNTIFTIPNLKARNEFLSLQVWNLNKGMKDKNISQMSMI